MGCENLDALQREGKEEELRNWASYRGQTLSRTGEKLSQLYGSCLIDPHHSHTGKWELTKVLFCFHA